MEPRDREARARLALGTPFFVALVGAAILALGFGVQRAVDSDDTEVTVQGPSGGDQAGIVTPLAEPLGGEQFFLTNCSACHGRDARGNIGSNLRSSAFLTGLTDSEVVGFLNVGRRIDDPANTTGIEMPAKGGNAALTDADLMEIVQFLRGIAE